METKTEKGKIAKEEHAECYICMFSDNYDDMDFKAGEEGGAWFHRECQQEIEDSFGSNNLIERLDI